MHYWINQLQPVPWPTDVVVSLNPVRPIDPAKILATIDYAHPVFDQAAIAAQGRVASLQGDQHRYYCGAWTGYGFHEDGLQSGKLAARAVLRDFQVPATLDAQPLAQAA